MFVNEEGVYEDKEGAIFVRCMADPGNPIFIDVSGEVWCAVWRGKVSTIDFSKYKLPHKIIEATKGYLKEKLEKMAPVMISAVAAMLNKLSLQWDENWLSFRELGLVDFRNIWLGFNSDSRYCLRRLYKYCAQNSLVGADDEVCVELDSWAARTRKYYKEIMEWDEVFGALTSDETELLRHRFMSRPDNESYADHFSRIIVWVLFETLKRPKQLAEMDHKSLWILNDSKGERECFLNIPKIKFQTGREPEAWPITNELAEEIEAFSERSTVKDDQELKERLLVSNCTRTPGREPSLTTFIQRWVERQNITSPRTGSSLCLTSRRIRHTGATQLAMQGVSSDEIQYILEHDSKDAANAYIDALSSELCPLIDRADQKLGGLFGKLSNVFFKGTIGNDLGVKQVLIPVVAQPAVVGTCELKGRCSKHPLYSCYNGCRYFIAWRNADHYRVLSYIESEYKRWSVAEGGNSRSKAVKDFERLYRAVSEVIEKIKNEG